MYAILKKFEPTEKGITVTFNCTDEQMPEIVSLYKKKVEITRMQEGLTDDPTIETLDGLIEEIIFLAGKLRAHVPKLELDLLKTENTDNQNLP